MVESETAEKRELTGTLRGPIGHALRHELGWTHYRIPMREDDLTQLRNLPKKGRS